MGKPQLNLSTAAPSPPRWPALPHYLPELAWDALYAPRVRTSKGVSGGSHQ